MKTIEPIKNHWIYWRWKGDKSLNKSYIQEIIDSPNGKILELSDGSMWESRPQKLLRKEIFIAQIVKP